MKTVYIVGHCPSDPNDDDDFMYPALYMSTMIDGQTGGTSAFHAYTKAFLQKEKAEKYAKFLTSNDIMPNVLIAEIELEE